MTNKEKYKQAFSVLHTSDEFSLEVQKMAIEKRNKKKGMIAAAIAACVLLAGGTGTVYAANVGGIQRTIQLWINGDQTDATLEINPDSSYNLSYKDADGNVVERSGGGIAIEEDGSEHPLTEDEIMEELYAPEVSYEEDGSVWLYYYDQKMDITDKFDADNICYIQLINGDETLYLTIKYQNGYASSPNKYINPSEFN